MSGNFRIRLKTPLRKGLQAVAIRRQGLLAPAGGGPAATACGDHAPLGASWT